MEFAGFIVALLIGVFAAGYALRGFIGKEIKRIGAELKDELVKAHFEAAKLVAEAKAKEAQVTQDLKADAAKVVEEVKSKL